MIFVDTDIFLHAAGTDATRREACQGVLGRLVEEEAGLVARTDAVVLSEALEQCREAGVSEQAAPLFDAVAALGIPILPVDEEALRRARLLLAAIAELDTRTAVHAGVMQAHGIDRVLSYDEGYDFVRGIERLEPWLGDEAEEGDED